MSFGIHQKTHSQKDALSLSQYVALVLQESCEVEVFMSLESWVLGVVGSSLGHLYAGEDFADDVIGSNIVGFCLIG